MIATFKYLLKSLREYKKDVALTWLFVLLETFCEILVPFLMQFLVQSIQIVSGVADASSLRTFGPLVQWFVDAINQTGVASPFIYGGIMAVMAALAAMCGIAAGYWSSSASAGLGKNLRHDMYYQVQRFSFNNIDKFSTSSIVTRTTTDVQNVQFAFQMAIRGVIRAPFTLIFAIIMSFITSWKLAFVFVAVVPVLIVLLILLATVVHPIFERIFRKYDDLNEAVQENITGIRVVKAFGRQEEEKEKFNAVSDFLYKNFLKTEKIMAFQSPGFSLLIYGSIIAIAWFGSNIILKSNSAEMNTSGLTTLFSYVMQVMMACMFISMIYVMTIISRNSAERIVELLKETPEINQPENALKEVKDGSIDFENVSFAYGNGGKVLQNINLHIKSGQTVGIIGSTGSSKTTLMSLIPRLYDVNEGTVKVGGVDVREYDIESLREAVSMVLQKNTLFTGTIEWNLRWGDENASMDEIKQACQIAQADGFISSFKDGYQTMIDEGGTNVSGGQKQRICIARALLKKPKILILDDSTSAVDTHTDSLIRQGIKEVIPGTTTFIVAQRILSVKDCDLILVMDKGIITEMGNNEELMEKSEVYRDLYISQIGGGDFDAAE
ncbi:MAG: ABC transporter ATP-binding protein/permease [Bacilli bacterium]|nr:ABC transporter ATP-binding protein/permease [Bacilli bacterium]